MAEATLTAPPAPASTPAPAPAAAPAPAPSTSARPPSPGAKPRAVVTVDPAKGKPEPGATERAEQNDAFADLDRMYSTPENVPQTETDPDEKIPQEATEKTEQAEPEAKPGEKPQKAGTLREAKDRAEARVKQLETELKTEREKVAKPVDDPDKPKLTAELETLRQRAQELEEEVQFTNFERSQHYKDTFEKPFVDAFKSGRLKLASLKVNGEDGAVRQGTEQDFDDLMRLTDDDAAAEMAAERFGAKSSIAMYHREKVLELHTTKEQAKERYRTDGVKRDQERVAEQKKMSTELAQVFDASRTEGQEKYPKLFKPVEGDDAGNQMLERGQEQTSAAFTGYRKNPQTGKLEPLPPKELARVRAAVWNKASNHDRAILQLQSERKRRQEAETKLKEFQGSVPEAGGVNRGAPSKPQGSEMDQAWDQLAKRLK